MNASLTEVCNCVLRSKTRCQNPTLLINLPLKIIRSLQYFPLFTITEIGDRDHNLPFILPVPMLLQCGLANAASRLVSEIRLIYYDRL